MGVSVGVDVSVSVGVGVAVGVGVEVSVSVMVGVSAEEVVGVTVAVLVGVRVSVAVDNVGLGEDSVPSAAGVDVSVAAVVAPVVDSSGASERKLQPAHSIETTTKTASMER